MKKNINIYNILLLMTLIYIMAFINNCGDSQSSALIGKWVPYDFDRNSGEIAIELFSDKTFNFGGLVTGSWTILEDGRVKLSGGSSGSSGVLLFSLKDGYLIGLDNPLKNIRYAKVTKDKDIIYYLKQNLIGTWQPTGKENFVFIFNQDGSLIIKSKTTREQEKFKYIIANEGNLITLNVNEDGKFVFRAYLNKLSKDDLEFVIEHDSNRKETGTFKRIK